MTGAIAADLGRQLRDAAHAAIAPNTPHVGVDLVEVETVVRQLRAGGENLFARWFTSQEAAYCNGDHDRLAATLAGKEATVKVLGTGFRAGVRWNHIEVLREPAGAPFVALHGAALRRARELGIERVAISLCHEGPFAVAVASAVMSGDAR
jgi:holo-[acyl-carrier protein] synthase